MSEKHFFGIAQGVHTGVTHVHKIGTNAAVGTNFEDIYDQGGKITLPTSAGVPDIASNLSNAGSIITIEGLDANYLEVSESLTLDSSGNATGSQPFLRINNAFVSNDSAISNVVRVTLDGSSGNQTRVEVAEQNSMQCIFTVPADKTAFLHQISVGIKTASRDAEARLAVTEFGGVERTRALIALPTGFAEKSYPIPLKFPQKTDIRLQAKTTGGDTVVTGSFDLVIVDNPL
jgi:hypothetical protein